VLSSEKYRVLVEQVLQVGGIFCLIYVALASPAIAKERVAARVRRGGHGIPDDKIEQRWKRSLGNLPWFVRRATSFWVVDNSNSDPSFPPKLIASGKAGKVEFLDVDTFAELKSALSLG
jgi:predicted ABC-type ATPase